MSIRYGSKSSALDNRPEIRRGTMLDEFRIVSLTTWVGKRQVTAKAAGAVIAFRARPQVESTFDRVRYFVYNQVEYRML
jgi:hypothetical protein